MRTRRKWKKYIKEATENVGKVLSEKSDYHVVEVKSTVVPKTTENVVIPLLEKYSGKKAGENFGVCMNPEFLTEIAGTWTEAKDFSRDFFTEDRIVIGEYAKRSPSKIIDFIVENTCIIDNQTDCIWQKDRGYFR